MKTFPVTGLTISLALLLGACGSDEPTNDAENTVQAAVLISMQQAETRDLPVWLETAGLIHARSAPVLAAEVDGRITAVHVDTGDDIEAGQLLAQIDTTTLLLKQQAAQARIERFVAHIANGERRVERLETLSSKNLSSQTQLDDARELLDTYRADHKAARAELAIINDQLAKSSITAAVSGVVQQRLISTGDFVRYGQPLFQITRPGQLQAWLPYAESVALKVRIGQTARIYSPLTPGEFFEGPVTELQPALGPGNRAIMAIVDINDPGRLKPEATLNARVLVETRKQAVLVPEISVVRRPAGNVVYVIEDTAADNKTVSARVVTTGLYEDGHVEILSGLEGHETVAADGAAFLTDGAVVKTAEPL